MNGPVEHLLAAQAAAQRLPAGDAAADVVKAVVLYRLAQALAGLGHVPTLPRPPAGRRQGARAAAAA